MSEVPDISDPYELFHQWFEMAADSDRIEDHTAFVLATADANGAPSARVILLKDITAEGFTFFTNLGSQKARELEQNPRAAMCFYWEAIGRQVRICGPVERVSDTQSDAYFATRPRNSQIGAWASKQSEPLESRSALLKRVDRMSEEFSLGNIPRPEFWSGFQVNPESIEFWLRGEHRLHDRVRYEREGDAWNRTRLYP